MENIYKTDFYIKNYKYRRNSPSFIGIIQNELEIYNKQFILTSKIYFSSPLITLESYKIPKFSIFLAATNKLILKYNLKERKTMTKWGIYENIKSCCMSPNDIFILSEIVKGGVEIWLVGVLSGMQVQGLNGSTGLMYSHPTNKLLITYRKKLTIWDPDNLESI